MNEERLNAVLREFQPDEAAEMREFALREPWEQNLYLFREVKGLKKTVSLPAAKPPTLQDRLYDFGYIGAFIAYALFDNRNNLPGIK